MASNSKVAILALFAAVLLNAAAGFVQPLASSCAGTASMATSGASSSTSLEMANEQDLIRWDRSARQAGADDNVVELKRPIGVVLAEDDNGNVYVDTVAPNGNAARSGKVCSLLRCELCKRI